MSRAPGLIFFGDQKADIAQAVIFRVAEARIREERPGEDVVTVLPIGGNGENVSRYGCAIAQITRFLGCQKAEICIS